MIFPPHPIRCRSVRRSQAGALLLALALAAAPATVHAGAAGEAQLPGKLQALGETQFLPVEQAFRMQWIWQDDGLAVGRFLVAPGYYLYRSRLRIRPLEPADFTLPQPDIPAGEWKDDPYTGPQQVFHQDFEMRQRIPAAAGQRRVKVEVTLQGCAEAGLCYPPVRTSVVLER